MRLHRIAATHPSIFTQRLTLTPNPPGASPAGFSLRAPRDLDHSFHAIVRTTPTPSSCSTISSSASCSARAWPILRRPR